MAKGVGLLLITGALVLSACASTSDSSLEREYLRNRGETLRQGQPVPDAAANAEANRAVHTDLIRGMLSQGQYYAALAHLEDEKRARGNSPELQYLEAETKRQLGKTADARQLYSGLMKTPYEGQAYHGLGLVMFKTDPTTALQHLRTAVSRRPTDARFRNDYGYALMESGRYGDALSQLSTAVELEPSNTLAVKNLVVLLLVNGEAVRARAVARDAGVSDAGFSALQQKAQALQATRSANAKR